MPLEIVRNDIKRIHNKIYIKKDFVTTKAPCSYNSLLLLVLLLLLLFLFSSPAMIHSSLCTVFYMGLVFLGDEDFTKEITELFSQLHVSSKPEKLARVSFSSW